MKAPWRREEYDRRAKSVIRQNKRLSNHNEIWFSVEHPPVPDLARVAAQPRIDGRLI